VGRGTFSELSVTEILKLGAFTRRERSLRADIDRVSRWFPWLPDRANQPAGTLSGGEQQMLAVARTLMGNPFLVLLDEPSEGVAPVIVEQMAQMILELKAEGVSILLSEQNMHFAELVSDRAYVLEKGQIRYSGSMEELAADEEVRRAYLSV
jgi:branched-chain amino acid transport system ATP-binding protein